MSKTIRRRKTGFFSFLDGVGSILEIYPAGSVKHSTKLLGDVRRHRNDADALHGDWQRVGKSMQSAVGKVFPERTLKGVKTKTD